MANLSRASGRLPAPHDGVEIHVHHDYRSTWVVEYTGTPAQLVAAGIVDEEMERKILSAKGGARINNNGHAYKLRSGRQRAHVQWKLNEPVFFRLKVHFPQQALQLPGVAALYPQGLPKLDDDDTARAYASRSAAPFATGKVVTRSRAIGRNRRLMRWDVISDKVIAPDWSWLLREQIRGT